MASRAKEGMLNLLDVVWLFSVGECWPALFSVVMPSVGGVTRGACVLFAH